jgi:hypothetical protein
MLGIALFHRYFIIAIDMKQSVKLHLLALANLDTSRVTNKEVGEIGNAGDTTDIQ